MPQMQEHCSPLSGGKSRAGVLWQLCVLTFGIVPRRVSQGRHGLIVPAGVSAGGGWASGRKARESSGRRRRARREVERQPQHGSIRLPLRGQAAAAPGRANYVRGAAAVVFQRPNRGINPFTGLVDEGPVRPKTWTWSGIWPTACVEQLRHGSYKRNAVLDSVQQTFGDLGAADIGPGQSA